MEQVGPADAMSSAGPSAASAMHPEEKHVRLGSMEMEGLHVKVRTIRTRSRTRGARALRRALGVLAVTGLCCVPVQPALADTTSPTRPTDTGSVDFGLSASTECTFGGDVIKSTPWSLQRVLLDQLWEQATGEGVTVAVIDTGVDDSNPQLRDAMASGGKDYVGSTDGTEDLEGHGTRVAGIIAARQLEGTGFVGIAPDAKILSFRYTGGEEEGNSKTMSQAIRDAVAKGAEIINISSDTAAKEDNLELRSAVAAAVDAGALVVAAAGNDGADGKSADTYPASYPGV
ncbi:S8 family serine peptidase, partial [Streptomyces sp. TRM76130]|nr:S8 family serine peptidase [Streptomyces sp. TRM76130]